MDGVICQSGAVRAEETQEKEQDKEFSGKYQWAVEYHVDVGELWKVKLLDAMIMLS